MAAIVAYPTSAWASGACAVVVPRPGRRIDLAEIQRFLEEQQIAVQYIPERLIVRDAMPATPSGRSRSSACAMRCKSDQGNKA